MILLSTLLASVVLTALSVPLLSRLALRLSLVDIPNDRKVHKRPIPRVGGLAMALGMSVPVIYWVGNEAYVEAFLAGASILMLFGLLDDCRDLAPRWKFAGQVTAASVAVFWGEVKISSLGMLAPEGLLLPGWLAVPLTIFVIVGVTNAINLSDGLDGLAGGISLLALCCICYLAYLARATSIGVIALALAGATFGFLRYNTYPATIFMGDVGSQLLGFSLIILALSLTQGSTPLSPMLPLVILGFPVLDTLTVMAGRMARGRSPFSADKTHFHHSLLGLGLHQTESVMMIYLIQVLLIAMAFLFRFHDGLLLIGYLAFCTCLLLLFSRARSRNWQLKRMGPMVPVDAYFAQLRESTLVKYLFRPLELGLSAVLLLSGFMCGKTSVYTASAALLAIAGILLLYRFRVRLLGDGLRVTLYLVVPFIIYQSAMRFEEIPSVLPVALYRFSFGVLALLNVLVARLTRRSHGFQSTPLDFLVLVVALVTPNLPEAKASIFSLGIVAAKIIICYFSCEVVFAEQRGNLRRMTLVTLVLLSILAVRGGE